MPWYHHGFDFSPKYSFSFDLLDSERRDISKPFGLWLDKNRREGMQAPIPDEVRPTIARQKNATRVKYDVLFGTYLPLVSEKFKNLVEDLSSGVNNFYLINITDKHGNENTNPYYIMQLMDITDSIIVEKSSINVDIDEFGYKSYISNTVNDYRTLRGGCIQGRGVWVERIFRWHIFFSDEFYEEYLSRGLSGLRVIHRAEVE